MPLFMVAVFVMVFIPGTAHAYTNEEECGFCKNEPDCCAEVRATKDATACDWPIRGYCTPATCGQVEGKGQRCGWYWIFHNANDNEYHLGTNSPAGYGCMIGDTEATMHPRCDPTPIPTAPPTSTPKPASRPTTVPIVTSRPNPTEATLPTTMSLPAQPPSLPTAYISPVAAPSVAAPPFQIPTLPMACATTAVRPDPFINLFNTLTFHDREIENAIYLRLLLVRYAILNALGLH